MARNRQRARDRKRKRRPDEPDAVEPLRDPPDALAPPAEGPPRPLDHASGEVEQAEAAIAAGAIGGDGDHAVEERPAGDGAAEPPRRRGGSRVLGFLRGSWAELRRVDWPDRRHTGQGTAVVLGFVLVAGAFLGLADVVAQKIVDFIL